MEDNSGWKTTLDRRLPGDLGWKMTSYGRQPCLEDDLELKMNLYGMEDGHVWNGRRPFMEWKTLDGMEVNLVGNGRHP